MAAGMLLGGFVVAVVGIACWSIPAACVVGGVVMFLAGGLEYRNRRPQP